MLSDYLSDELLNWLKGTDTDTAPTALYLSLHSADPGPDGTANDVSTAMVGGRTELDQANLGAAADYAPGGRVVSSTDVVDFTASALVGGVVTHVGLWDASSGGNYLAGDALTASVTVVAGDIIRIPTGQLQLITIGSDAQA